ncbi:MAG: transposase [Bacteroidia bacterium]|nr:transposase [Bacteroidia bacterium]MBT8229400.1 transposase [Bacteroidia bacterium]
MKRRRKFDKAFKLEVVKRSLTDISLKELSEDLQIHPNMISRWRKQYLDQGEDLSFPGNGIESMSEEQKEIKRLNKALREKELELEILKKAINIFSKKDRISTNL